METSEWRKIRRIIGAENRRIRGCGGQKWQRHQQPAILKVTERRTMVDFAYCLRDLVDIHFPQADTIVLVMDNLNTHKLASLYEAFPAAEARRLRQTGNPLHAQACSWLNMGFSEC